MASRLANALLIVAVLAGALGGLAVGMEAPAGVLGLPAGDKDQVPCGGAAVLIGADGLALTLEEALPANHGEQVTVVMPGGAQRQATIVKRGMKTTAILLRIADPPSGATPMILADSAALQVGDPAWTAGNSFGSLEQDGVAAISRGVISGLYAIPEDSPPVHGRGGRVLSGYRGAVIEIDAAVNDGNQGGALMDAAGHVIGLVSLGTARERRLGTAIPIHLVLQDLGLQLPLSKPAANGDAAAAALARAATATASGVALVYFERTGGIGNPPAVPRPSRLVNDAPAHERERLQNWWDAYYHQQQMFYTDQPVSALVIDPAAGLLLTASSNLHGDAERGQVLIPGGASIPCSVQARHLPLDLALIKADRALPLVALTFAPSPQLVVGAPVGIVGRHQVDGGFTLTSGVVSATARRLQQNEFAFAQTDAHANYGSLGGAVVDAGGAVVGMLVKLGPNDETWPWAINSGVALFIDSASILRVLPQLKQGATTDKSPIVGLGVELRYGNGSRPVIRGVKPGSGAADAGLKAGDQLQSVDGIDAVNHLAVTRALLKHHAGDHLDVVLLRDGKPLTLTVEVRTLNE